MTMQAFSRNKEMKVLVVEDHAGLAEVLVEEIVDAGFKAQSVDSAEAALPLITSWAPDLVVSDLRLPGSDGLALLKHVQTFPVPPGFLVITAFGTVPQAVDALQAGADDFLTKPLDLRHFVLRVTRLLKVRRMRAELDGLRKIVSTDEFQGMYGTSQPMRHLFAQIKKVATASGPVLVLGESGTGKELVAQAIHQCSDRAKGPFLAVNCAGIPEPLMESEFFGHAAGAFTGANKARRGLFHEAEGGTLLLDEIAEMPLMLQSKLLRILQDGRVRSVGGNREQRVDVRVVAATHQNLEEAVQDGRVRGDLFYRLETFTLRVPPLRERGEDIEALAHRFMVHFCARMGQRIRGMSDPALDLLRIYPFPGNVRELRNAVERAVTFCNGTLIRPEHWPSRIRAKRVPLLDPNHGTVMPANGFDGDPPPPLAEIERRYIHYVLRQTGGNKRRAAEILGVTRKTLYRRLNV